MSSFNARLRLPHSKLPLGVEVDISHERMTLTSGERTVAAWPLEKLDVESLGDGFHIKVDGDDFVLNVTDSVRFAAEVGMDRRPIAVSSVVRAAVDSRTDMRPSQVATEPDRDLFDAMQSRVADVTAALTSEEVTPAEAFARWLILLKEINSRHGQGYMPTEVYYRLNTQLLDLIPEPAPEPT